MKKKLALILILSLIPACLGGCKQKAPQQETAAENPVDWRETYADYIIAHKSDFTEEAQPNIIYISANDLNFDGTPELIVSGTAASAAYECYVFRISDNRVVPVEVPGLTDKEKSLYSVFREGWLTLRRNQDTGELKYVLLSSNGGSEESFGNIISFGANEDHSLKILNEFEYLDYVAPDYKPEDDEFYVSGKKVSQNEYDAAKEAFYNIWEDTEQINYAMMDDVFAAMPSSCSKTVSMSLERDDLIRFFEMYQPEI